MATINLGGSCKLLNFRLHITDNQYADILQLSLDDVLSGEISITKLQLETIVSNFGSINLKEEAEYTLVMKIKKEAIK